MTAAPKSSANGGGSGGSGPKKPAAASKMKRPSTTKKASSSSSSSLLRVGILLAVLAVAALLLASSGNSGSSNPLSDKITSLRDLLEKRWDHFAKARASGASGASPAAPPASSAPSIKTSSSSSSTCDAASLALAATKLAPLASRLAATPFFRHFKVALRCECPFWPDDGMCSMSDCAVCECPAEEVPEALRDGDEPRELASCSAAAEKKANDADAAVDREVEPGTRARLIAAKGWRGVDNPWMAGSVVVGEEKEGGREEEGDSLLPEDDDEDEDDEDDEDEEDDEDDEDEEDAYSFIDLLKNPERYTGYSGPSARRIWDFVYSQTCFGGRGAGGGAAGAAGAARGAGGAGGAGAGAGRSVCSAVQQTLYRVMSGVHSSISAHIAADYLLEPASSAAAAKANSDGKGTSTGATAAKWGPNLALFAERLSLPEHAERVDNLRFAYAFVARALLSARPLLLAADYGAGAGGEGKKTTATTTAESELVRELLTDPALEGVCAAPFDAARHLPLSSSSGGGGGGPASGGERALERELQAAFRNVTAVMDCVGCEKCKLWGKLQLMGVATALKVLVAERRAGEALAAAARAAAGTPAVLKPLVLERNEVVALVNLFERLSRSVVIAAEMQARLDAGEVPSWPAGAARGSGGGGEREAQRADALAGAVGVF